MRKFFAMVATVAVVLSMFSGIAFAADGPTAVNKVILSVTTQTLASKSMQELVINGQIVDVDGKLIAEEKAISVDKDGADATGTGSWTTPSTTGTFTYRELIADGKAAKYEFTVGGKTATFWLSYSMTLTNRSDINFNLADAQQEAIIGVVKYADGTVVKGAPATDVVELYWLDADGLADGGAIATSPLGENGQFGMFAPAFTKAGNIGLFVNGVKHLTGKVTAYGMTATVTPSTGIAHSVDTATIELKLASGPKSVNSTVKFVIKKADAEIAKTGTVYTGLAINYDGGAIANVGSATVAFNADGKNDKKIEIVSDFKAAGLKAGTYTVTATADSKYTATATFTVVNPSSYTLVDSTGLLEDQKVANHAITFGKAGAVQVVKYSAGTVTTPDLRYVIYVDGEQTKDFTDPEATAANYTVTLKPTTGSSKTVRVVAYEKNSDNKWVTKVFDKTYTIKFTGWDVTYDVKTVVLKEETQITFVVKDLEGNFINNARIQIVGDDGVAKTFVNPETTSISNGEYTGKVKYNVNTGTLYIRKITIDKKKADSTYENMATFSEGLTVIGKPVYTVTAGVDSLLLGKKEAVVLTAMDGENKFVPSVVYQQIGTAQPTALAITPKTDGTFGVTVTPEATKDITLRVESADGTKTGSVVLKVVKPKLVVEEGAAVTENFNSLVKFQIVDPRNGEAVEKDLAFDYGNYITEATDVVVLDNAKNQAGYESALGAATHEMYFRITNVDWKTAETDEKAVAIKLTAKLDKDAEVDGTIAVKQATLSSNPETVILGQANNLVLTLTDANGKAIAGKKIHLGDNNTGAVVGTTDDKGQVVYATAAASNFAAVTDVTGTYVKKQVVAGVDNAAPTVEAPATTDKNTATITLKDNVRIIRVRINGVEDTAFFPGATYTHNVNLKAGANTFTVEAMDNNYNTLSTTVTITYTPAANNSTVLQGGAVERKGDYVFVQIRQFEDLGATLTWNAAAKTATFVAGGKTVEVTVGSTTAKVNGVAATMPSAPINVGGRVMVPTRFIAEALGWTVDWAAGDIVTITLP